MSYVEVPGGRLETLELPGEGTPLVLLHEGLGSAKLWRKFPAQLRAATGHPVIAFSRFGHGRSDPPPRKRVPGFMHDEALEVLPALLAEHGIERPILIGHSDGASIALIHAAHHPVEKVVVMAPHVFVEEMCLVEIREAKRAFEEEDLRKRMAKHHADPEAAFYGWADVWLDPEWPQWTIEDELPAITAPLLLIQGEHDEYGTMEQLDRIERLASGPVRRLHVDAGHSPHLKATEATLASVTEFVTSP